MNREGLELGDLRNRLNQILFLLLSFKTNIHPWREFSGIGGQFEKFDDLQHLINEDSIPFTEKVKIPSPRRSTPVNLRTARAMKT